MTDDDALGERLVELAALLAGCRDVFLACYNDGLLAPVPGSQAAHDFTLALTGPGGDWAEDIHTQPRALAAKLVRQQADYCVGVGALVAEREVFDPMSSLVRGAFEYGTRAIWILDPRANDPRDTSTGHRTRIARAVLMELVSTHHARESVKDREGLEEVRDGLKVTWRGLRRLATDLFADVSIDGDPTRWRVGGVAYESWTEVAAAWAELQGTGIPGGRIYQLLAVEGHPQGFVATRGLAAGTDGLARTIELADVQSRVQLVVVSFYSALTLLANYHGYESSILQDWEGRIESVLPTAFA